jgi:branched-chain amino acid transport system ATP-binding protein
MPLLEIKNLKKYFSGLAAVNDVGFSVNDGEIAGLIGPNGAGKTTLFNLISGFHPPDQGEVIFAGENITALRADQVARKGIGRTFQASTLFMQSTVFSNVFSAFYRQYRQPGWKAFLHTPKVNREELAIKKAAMDILNFMGLASLGDEQATNLPHGHQRALGICIALATEPRLLLLDEPLTGMNPSETMEIVRKIRQIQEKGITILLVEHNMRAVMDLCDKITVLNYGRKIAEGTPEEIRENREVTEAYLGREEA